MKKIRVGITGGIGSGKTVIGSIIEKMGFPVFYADKVAKELIQQSESLKEKIIALLGKNAYDQNGNYNTQFVGQVVFNNPEKLTELNELIHPFVRTKFDDFVDNSASEIVFNESAILYETGSYQLFDKIILVTAPLELRIQRCIRRDNVDANTITDRIKNQWSDEKKRLLSPYEIKNDEFLPLLKQVEKFISEISPKKKPLTSREDIEILVREFYSKVMQDEVLTPFFKNLNFDLHLPKMVDFWCFILIGTVGYKTNVIEKHLHMPLQKEHFEHWLSLFYQTLDELFMGENVEIAKQRASIIAWTTKSKINLN